MKHAIILFGHGSRDPEWARPLHEVAARIRERRPGLSVVPAFLEFLSPTLEQACACLVDEGVERIVLLPMFMSANGHVRRDLPDMLEVLHRRWPQLNIELQPVIGQSDSVLWAMAQVALDLCFPQAE